ncbi:antitoxin Xre/MbcA/ParS toxin-binding domain-containing protein [Variovorax atrisoli]|uniref:antitoxin Xre/MbcA/ParS toxin-binding domain-containing protein n=1 Tax=Variovorax atrisoli TaxID=3394203 RepID=UPI00403FF153
MPKTETSNEMSAAFPIRKADGDLEWLHHRFSIKKRTGGKALGTARATADGSGAAVVDIGGDKRIVVDFRRLYEADPMEQVSVIKRGVNARLIYVIADSMQMPKEKLIDTLGLARATIRRKCHLQTALSSDESSRVMGVSKLIGQVQTMVQESAPTDNFDPAVWVAQWLDRPLPALNGYPPGYLMDTAEGQAIVSQLVKLLQSGAYA